MKISSDWLNPMLLRDLRQGLRARGFTIAFLLLQCAMALFVVSGLFSADRTNMADALTGMFWFGIVLFFFVGLPLVAVNSLTLEFRDNRLDLLKLTQMRARGLIWGKWLSLTAQGAMVASSLLPYMILNYFVGSYDLISDLGSLALTLGASAVLVGGCLAISAVNQPAVRALAFVGGVLVLIFGISGRIFFLLIALTGRMGPGGGRGSMSFSGGLPFGAGFLLLVCAGLPVLFLALEFGASRLAPSAENHDTPQRFVVLVLMALGAAMVGASYWTVHAHFWQTVMGAFFALMVAATIWVMALASAAEPLPYPGAYRPFVRWGALGRWVGRLLLYPGWPSAVFFILLMSALLAGFSEWVNGVNGFNGMHADVGDRLAFYLLLTPALMFPQVAGALLFKRLNAGARYLWVIIIGLIVVIICSIFSGFSDSHNMFIFACLFPPNALFLLGTDAIPAGNAHDLAAIAAMLTSIPTLVIAIARSVQYWPKFTVLERRAAAPLSPPPPEIPPAPSMPPEISSTAEKSAGA